MIKELFAKKQQYINHFFQHVDLQAAEKFLNYLATCSGNMIFSGVGKSGLIAKKIALTMTSTGSRALYLSPLDALHGDLGLIHFNDVFIMLSKSGESDELFSLIPFLKQKGVPLLGIVSNSNSRLSKACDFSMVLPYDKEICPFNMAPTTSTTVQLMFGDILAVALMQKKNFSLNQYALNHPAGNIGKRLTFSVKDLMLTGPALPVCSGQDLLFDILVELSNKRSGCILIVDDKMKLEGLFTDGDLRRALVAHGQEALRFPIERLMTKSPRCLSSDTLAWDAMKMMEERPNNAITCMPVVDAQHRLEGLIRLHDIVQAGI